MCQPKFVNEEPPAPADASKSKGHAGANRSRLITLDEMMDQFHLPITEAAQRLGVCVTVLKQQCREHGINRWPFRKVRKLDNMLQVLETTTPPEKMRPFALTNGEAERKRKIDTVKEALNQLLHDPNSSAHLKLGKSRGLRTAASTAAAQEASANAPQLPAGLLNKEASSSSLMNASPSVTTTGDAQVTTPRVPSLSQQGETSHVGAPSSTHAALACLLMARAHNPVPQTSTFTPPSPTSRLQPFLPPSTVPSATLPLPPPRPGLPPAVSLPLAPATPEQLLSPVAGLAQEHLAAIRLAAQRQAAAEHVALAAHLKLAQQHRQQQQLLQQFSLHAAMQTTTGAASASSASADASASAPAAQAALQAALEGQQALQQRRLRLLEALQRQEGQRSPKEQAGGNGAPSAPAVAAATTTTAAAVAAAAAASAAGNKPGPQARGSGSFKEASGCAAASQGPLAPAVTAAEPVLDLLSRVGSGSGSGSGSPSASAPSSAALASHSGSAGSLKGSCSSDEDDAVTLQLGECGNSPAGVLPCNGAAVPSAGFLSAGCAGSPSGWSKGGGCGGSGFLEMSSGAGSGEEKEVEAGAAALLSFGLCLADPASPSCASSSLQGDAAAAVAEPPAAKRQKLTRHAGQTTGEPLLRLAGSMAGSSGRKGACGRNSDFALGVAHQQLWSQ